MGDCCKLYSYCLVVYLEQNIHLIGVLEEHTYV